MSFEQALSNSIFNQPSNKSYNDKLLAVMQADKIELLIKKDELSQSDLRLLQSYLCSNEVKLVNVGDTSRYLLGKYLSWIQQFIEIQQFHIKSMQSLEEKKLNTDFSLKNNLTAYKLLDEYIKTIVHSYLFWLRSGMSLNMIGVKTFTSNSYEFQYGQQAQPKLKETSTSFGGS